MDLFLFVRTIFFLLIRFLVWLDFFNYRSFLPLINFSWRNSYNPCRRNLFLLTFFRWCLRIRLRTMLWILTYIIIRQFLWIFGSNWWYVIGILLSIRINIDKNLCIFNIFGNPFCLLIYILAWLIKYFFQRVYNLFIESLLVFDWYVTLYFFLKSTYFLQWFFSHRLIMSVRTWEKLTLINKWSKFLHFLLNKYQSL